MNHCIDIHFLFTIQYLFVLNILKQLLNFRNSTNFIMCNKAFLKDEELQTTNTKFKDLFFSQLTIY